MIVYEILIAYMYIRVHYTIVFGGAYMVDDLLLVAVDGVDLTAASGVSFRHQFFSVLLYKHHR
jgi:hypothetical protein